MLKLKNLSIPNLKPVDLCVEAGNCVGLTGDSGCGKTRLLRAIADMDEHSGEVCVDTFCKEDLPGHEWRQRVALLPAESQWWFDTVAPHFHGNVTSLETLGFQPEVMNWQLARCSSGEKQRLGILRLLENQPRVLLLDEPTANLDAENIRKVELLISNYLSDHQAIALWVTHNRAQLKRVSTGGCYDLTDGGFCLLPEG